MERDIICIIICGVVFIKILDMFIEYLGKGKRG